MQSPLARHLRIEPLEERLALAVITVDSLADGVVNLADATVTLRDALEAANNNVQVSPGGPIGSGADEIRFQSGLTGTITLLEGQLSITDDLMLTGPGANLLTIHGNNASLVFLVTDQQAPVAKTVTISGLTITGGRNLAGSGGAIFNAENLTIQNSTLTGNQAVNGAGIFNLNSGTLLVQNSTVSNNTANAAGGSGGGIFNNNTLIVKNSTISGNTAGIGSGIYNQTSSTLTIQNSTISGNRANATGGGIVNAGTLTMQSSTVTQNHTYDNGGANTPNTGGGVFYKNNTISNGTTTLHNTIVADNYKGSGTTIEDNIDLAAASSGTPVVTGTNNLVGMGNAGGLTNGVNGNKVGVENPLLGPLMDLGGPTKTHPLLALSPALNSGNIAQVPGDSISDQRGSPFLRVFGFLDIGAFEAQPMNVVVDIDADEADGNETSGDFSLREAINRTNANLGADTITFAADFSTTPRVISLGLGQFLITDDLTLTGPGANLLTINGNNASIIFLVTDQQAAVARTVTISGLTISGGRNMVGSGGAIFNAENLTVQSSTITASQAVNGAGFFNLNSGTLLVQNSTISNNLATSSGGGIFNSGTLAVENSTISGNRATTSAGGVAQNYTATATTLLRNTTISQNHSDNNNAGAEPGGGILVGSGAVTLHNSIVADNFRGSGVLTEDDISGSLNASSTHNLIGTGGSGGLTNGTNGNQVGVANPLLGSLADNGGPTLTHALLAHSPAINMGDNAQAPPGLTTDQRGGAFARVVNVTVDIGAFELQPPGPALPGDYNQNNIVDAADYVLWRDTFGRTGVAAFSGADGDGDGTIAQGDYAVWRTHFGQSLPAAGAGATGDALAAAPAPARNVSEVSPKSAQPKVLSKPAWFAAAENSPRIRARQDVATTRRSIDLLHDDALLAWLSS
ncbi:MAG: choice-of-anchor Q domain-containing protein, partial [Pirellulales bacterium]